MDRNNAFVSMIILILILVGCYQWWEKERIAMVELPNREKTVFYQRWEKERIAFELKKEETKDSLACLKRLVDGGQGKRKCSVYSLAESTKFESCYSAGVSFMVTKPQTQVLKDILQAGYWVLFPNGAKHFVPISHYGTSWCNFMKRLFGLHHVELTEYNPAIPMDQNQRVFYGTRCHVIKNGDEVWEDVEGAEEEVKTTNKVLRCCIGDAFAKPYVDIPIVRVKGVKVEANIGTAEAC